VSDVGWSDAKTLHREQGRSQRSIVRDGATNNFRTAAALPAASGPLVCAAIVLAVLQDAGTPERTARSGRSIEMTVGRRTSASGPQRRAAIAPTLRFTSRVCRARGF
jgi:hypothetical protein